MKKTFLLVLFMCCLAGVTKAQNIQLHYDWDCHVQLAVGSSVGYHYR